MSQHTKKEPTNREVLQAIQGQKVEILETIQGVRETLRGQIRSLEEKVDEGFQSVDERFNVAFEIFATKEELRDTISDLATKVEFAEFKNEMLDRFDTVITQTSMLNQERASHLDWLRRHDNTIEQHTKDISLLKTKLTHS